LWSIEKLDGTQVESHYNQQKEGQSEHLKGTDPPERKVLIVGYFWDYP
jgi:hypothetical protein